jgi:RNA polymerase sigma factor (sigma-70 family)
MTAPAGDDAERARFRALYEANYDSVLGYALRRAGDADAMDIVSETFLVCWRRLNRVPEGDEGRLWLYGTARRVLANHARGERRRARLSGRLSETAYAVPDNVYGTGAGGAVATAFSRLRCADRELLALVAWEGLGAHEIARVIGCSRNAARIRLHRARRRFMEELESEDEHRLQLPPLSAPISLAKEEHL